jgi:hypothetical protein
MHIVKHRYRPLCEACRTVPCELKTNGTGWKKRCSDCQRAYELASDRERMAQRKVARLGSSPRG